MDGGSFLEQTMFAPQDESRRQLFTELREEDDEEIEEDHDCEDNGNKISSFIDKILEEEGESSQTDDLAKVQSLQLTAAQELIQHFMFSYNTRDDSILRIFAVDSTFEYLNIPNG